MLNSSEMAILVALKRLGKREGIFPPIMLTLKNQFEDMEYNVFFQHVMSLQDKGYLKVASGKARGLFISKEGFALAEALEQEHIPMARLVTLI